VVVVSDTCLTLSALTLRFAGLTALDGIDLQVPEGSLYAVIGPNGAGKTSLFNCISGVYRPDSGRITLFGEDLLGEPPHRVAARGVARMFQNLALFDNLTTLDNLLVGCHHGFSTRWWHDVLWLAETRRQEVAAREIAEEVIDFLELERYRAYPVGLLPYGVRKRIELGRALCMRPRLLLLDEPAAGLNQEETEELASFIVDIGTERRITQILIEHELALVMDLADRIAVLDFGRKIADSTPEKIRRDPKVAEAYLGLQPEVVCAR
jgi:branched-chain amino acid transport system ATP-binding protein